MLKEFVDAIFSCIKDTLTIEILNQKVLMSVSYENSLFIYITDALFSFSTFIQQMIMLHLLPLLYAITAILQAHFFSAEKPVEFEEVDSIC